MELICNELSFNRIAQNNVDCELKMREFFKCFETTKKEWGFKSIRFHENLLIQEIMSDVTFAQWLEIVNDSILKNLIISFFKKPYTDDLNDEELQTFLEGTYSIDHDEVPTTESPLGLPISNILSTLSISVNSHFFWKKHKIKISKFNSKHRESLFAINICSTFNIYDSDIQNQVDKSLKENIKDLDSDTLTKYLRFKKYKVLYNDKFLTELFNWKKKDYTTYDRILELMKDVEQNPFSGGMGQTENLRNRGKEASKRISNSYPDGDRLSYTIENNTVEFISCKGHYKFH